MNWYEPRVRSTHSIVTISNDSLVVRGARESAKSGLRFVFYQVLFIDTAKSR